MMSPQPQMMMGSPQQPSMQPMRQPEPMYQEPPRQPMPPQHQPMYREEPQQYREAPRQQEYREAPQYEQAPQPVRFEAAPAQGQCGDQIRGSPQQQPMAAQFVQEVEVPKVIQAPSAPPCELGGFREFIVEETRPVVE